MSETRCSISEITRIRLRPFDRSRSCLWVLRCWAVGFTVWCGRQVWVRSCEIFCSPVSASNVSEQTEHSHRCELDRRPQPLRARTPATACKGRRTGGAFGCQLWETGSPTAFRAGCMCGCECGVRAALDFQRSSATGAAVVENETTWHTHGGAMSATKTEQRCVQCGVVSLVACTC